MSDAATIARAPVMQPDEGLAYREYVLAELRCAILRARLAALDIETAGIALRAGMIEADTALEWLRDAGALEYVAPMQLAAKEAEP